MWFSMQHKFELVLAGAMETGIWNKAKEGSLADALNKTPSGMLILTSCKGQISTLER